MAALTAALIAATVVAAGTAGYQAYEQNQAQDEAKNQASKAEFEAKAAADEAAAERQKQKDQQDEINKAQASADKNAAIILESGRRRMVSDSPYTKSGTLLTGPQGVTTPGPMSNKTLLGV